MKFITNSIYTTRKLSKYLCPTEMDDVLLVHMLDALTNLPHIINDFRLGHSITLSRNSLE